MKQSVIGFLRPTFVGLLLFGVTVVAIESYLWVSARRETSTSSAMNQWAREVYPTPLQPTEQLSPTDVVNNQLNALADPDHARGILQCWAFASPANRAATGPPERFGKMLLEPPYDILAASEGAIVGDPILIDGRARVFVGILNDQRPQSFVWVLSKQLEAPWTDCWMTDAVFAVGDEDEPQEASGRPLGEV